MDPRRILTVALLALLPLAAVGPNVAGHGLRTEHLYAAGAVVGLLLIHRGLPRQSMSFWLVIMAWTGVFMITLIGEIWPVTPAYYPPHWQVALGRIGMPILAMLIGAYVGQAASPARSSPGQKLSLLDIVMLAAVIVACLNAAVAVASVLVELPWLSMFRPETVDETVGERAAQGGRYGGMVNQPVEAGMLYSVALLTVSRLWMTRVVPTRWFIALAATVGAGGAMAGSKGFWFGGLPITLAYLLLSNRPPTRRRYVGVAAAAALATAAAWFVLSTFNRPGLERFSALYLPWRLEAPRSTLFSQRLDPGSATMHALETVFRNSGPFALTAPPQGAYDIGVMEFATVAGWAGVAGMLLIAVALLVSSLSRRRESYWLALTVFVLTANLGGPAFTANRNALVIWVLLGAMLQLGRYRPVAGAGTPVVPEGAKLPVP